jgi:twitching motility two-component system response regulator PilH
MGELVKILLVDDDRMNLFATRRLLEGAGYEILSAEDGEAGLQMARTHKPDLVLMTPVARSSRMLLYPERMW